MRHENFVCEQNVTGRIWERTGRGSVLLTAKGPRGGLHKQTFGGIVDFVNQNENPFDEGDIHEQCGSSRILIPSIGVIIFAAILIIFVRVRSARRELALMELAARNGLKYTPGGMDFFQGSWPGKVGGVCRDCHNISILGD